MQVGFRNVQVMSRGVNTDLFDLGKRSENLRRSWGCSSEERVVLHVGRLAVLLRYGAETPTAVIPTGIVIKQFGHGDGGRFRRRHGIPADRPVLIHVGRIGPGRSDATIFVQGRAGSTRANPCEAVDGNRSLTL